MIVIYYILYCESTNSYIYKERKNCWQYTNQDLATKFDSLEESDQIRTKLQTKEFPPLIIYKMKQTSEIMEACL